jgi:hypothetical protein
MHLFSNFSFSEFWRGLPVVEKMLNQIQFVEILVRFECSAIQTLYLAIAVLLPGFSFSEFTCLRASTSKVVCCHFSSDGKLLASAGHDKKVSSHSVSSDDWSDET